MARTRTLALMRDEAKELADMANSSFVADSMWTRWINQGCAEVRDLLVRARGYEFFATSSTLSTTANVETVALPSTYYKILGVSVSLGGQWYRMHRFEPGDIDRLDVAGGFAEGWNGAGGPRYLPQAGALLLRPIPAAVYSIKVRYCACHTDLSADGDTYDGFNGWEDYPVIFAAIKALTKEESDTSALRADLAMMRERIERMASEGVDESEPMTVQDVTSRYARDVWGDE